MKRTPRAVPEVVPNGKLVTLQPAALTVKAAAIYTAHSESLLNQLRARDAKALREGRPLEGPEWRLMRAGIRYTVTDLDAWLARTSVRCGVMESRRRASAETGDE